MFELKSWQRGSPVAASGSRVLEHCSIRTTVTPFASMSPRSVPSNRGTITHAALCVLPCLLHLCAAHCESFYTTQRTQCERAARQLRAHTLLHNPHTTRTRARARDTSPLSRALAIQCPCTNATAHVTCVRRMHSLTPRVAAQSPRRGTSAPWSALAAAAVQQCKHVSMSTQRTQHHQQRAACHADAGSSGGSSPLPPWAHRCLKTTTTSRRRRRRRCCCCRRRAPLLLLMLLRLGLP